ncbi:MAG: right-handed parallel beta-helix repeat-containing protein [bacterium]|nr:right-handed parallel beta-helix repeat-containing protein [bacterium]
MRRLLFIALMLMLAGGAQAFATLAMNVYIQAQTVPFVPPDLAAHFAQQQTQTRFSMGDWSLVKPAAQSIPADAVRLRPGENIQAMIEQHPAGTTFVLEAGTYRLQSVTPRDGDTFIGDGAASEVVLSGAALLTEFTREGSYWVASGQTQEGEQRGECAEGYERCIHPEDLYFDDIPLRHVSSLDQVAPGTWYFDYPNDRVYFSDDPTGRTVEISVLPHAFQGTANNVTLRRLTVEKYATPAQRGTIRANETTGWVIDDVTAQLNHGTGIYIGSDTQLRNSRMLANGQSGLGSNRITGGLVENNEIALNNYAGFQMNWAGAATKFARTHFLTIRGNYVHNNAGVGLWTDIDNWDILYENNLVVSNARQGIYHEISYAAVIRNNIVALNGAQDSRYLLYGAQILISSSSGVEVYNNLVITDAEVARGIGVMQQDRGDGDYGDWLAHNNYVHRNIIVYLGESGESGVINDSDEQNFWFSSNNRFEFNTYYAPNPDAVRWYWNDQEHSWEQLQTLGQEQQGEFRVGVPQDLQRIPSWQEAQRYNAGSGQ